MKDKLTKYFVLMPEFCMGEIMGVLNSRGAWFESLYRSESDYLLEASVSKENMDEFEEWPKLLSDGKAKLFSKCDKDKTD